MAPIGISFLPGADNAGENQSTAANALAPTTDLAQAYKILSLRLPTVVGAAPTSARLLNGAGASGLGNLPGGLNPYAALFQALIKAGLTGTNLPGLGDSGSAPGMPMPDRVVPKISFPQDHPPDPGGTSPDPVDVRNPVGY